MPEREDLEVQSRGTTASSKTPDHGTGTRYRLRCTLSRVKAYISAVGPGTTLLKGITRAPGSFNISCSDGSPWTILSGTRWPGANGKT